MGSLPIHHSRLQQQSLSLILLPKLLSFQSLGRKEKPEYYPLGALPPGSTTLGVRHVTDNTEAALQAKGWPCGQHHKWVEQAGTLPMSVTIDCIHGTYNIGAMAALPGYFTAIFLCVIFPPRYSHSERRQGLTYTTYHPGEGEGIS